MRINQLVMMVAHAAHAQRLRVILLGTGTPWPSIDRFGPSTLVDAGTEKLVFDVGRGASQSMWQLGMPLRAVIGVFLTHLHSNSNHTVGLPDFWLDRWAFRAHSEAARHRFESGPTGTEETMSALETACQADIGIRIENQDARPEGLAVVAENIAADNLHQCAGDG